MCIKCGDSPIFRKYVVGWCSGAFSPLLSFPASREQYLHIFDLIICSRRRGRALPSFLSSLFFFLPCPKVSGHKSEDLAVFAAAAAIPYRPSPLSSPDSENEGEITVDKGDRAHCDVSARSLATFLGSARPVALATLRPGSR